MGAGRSLGAVANRLATVAVAGAVIAAAGTGLFYWHDAGPVAGSAGPIALARMASPDLFQAVPDAEDRRQRAPYPIEFERQFPLIAAAADTPVAVPVLPRVEAHAATARAIPSSHGGCAARCTHVAAIPTPPRRPEALRVVPEAVTTLAAAVTPEKPVRILGLALPYLPTGEAVLQTVADLRTNLHSTMAEVIDTTLR